MTERTTRRLVSALALGAALVTADAARAQVFTPGFMAPASSGDVGGYVSETGGGTAIEAIWRQRAASYDLGLRGGFVDLGSGAFTVGAELRAPIHAQTDPIALAFTAAGQGVFGDVSAIGFNAGITAGHTFVPGTFTFTPYLHPKIALARSLEGGHEFNADAQADLGVDFGFQPNLSLRFNVGLASASPDWGIGLAWRR
jgi:hypothetical protein